eukprot:SAG31_NODE_609_length_13567_cov_18.101574_4_plen_31_part_00
MVLKLMHVPPHPEPQECLRDGRDEHKATLV